MRLGIKKLIREYLNEMVGEITYTHEHVDSYDGQNNYEIGMYMDDDIIGVVEYTTYEGELTISNIIVRPEYRRRGVASRLVKMMKDKHPEYTYVPSMKTDDGAKFKHNDVKDLYNLDK
jgi:ribosomal protein S18 acetylase RimI-like enzyme